MLKSIAVRVSQDTRYIKDPRRANPIGFRGKPVIGARDCGTGCVACVAACPTEAITLNPVQIDLGRCVLCGACEPACRAPSSRSRAISSWPAPSVAAS